MVPSPDDVLTYLPAGSAAGQGSRPFVVIVRTPEELGRWLDDQSPGLQWIQVEGLIDDLGVWATAAHSATDTPLDVVLSNPEAEFASLYRLVDVHASRDVRVTMPVLPGFMKALRLAGSLGLPVRLLLGQPSPDALSELARALDFYLHDPMVDAPVEPFHSLLAGMNGVEIVSLWTIQEMDPAVFVRHCDEGHALLSYASAPEADNASASKWATQRMPSSLGQDGECASCPWNQVCAGYFKWPDRTYSCVGVKRLFAVIAAAASELARDLTGYEAQEHPR